MPNTFLTPQMVANEALMVLLSNLTMANLVHRDYSAEFAGAVGDTVNVRKPATFVAKNFTGTVSAQDATEGSVAVKLDRFRDVTAKVTSKDLTLNIKDFSIQIVTPAMQSIAQAVDSDLIALGIQKAGITVSGTANATNLADIGNMGKSFDINKVPVANRRFVMHPTHKYRYALTDNLSKVSYAGDSKALRDAEIGKVYSFDTFMDQNCPDAPASTGTATAYKVSATAGATTVALSSLSAATATIKEGDSFIIDGYRYTFAEDKTGASSAIATIAIDQPIHKSFDEEDALPIKAANSLAFHRNGIALVTRPLALPRGAKDAAIASADGLGVRVVYDYDVNTKQDTVSFDILYGIKELDVKMLGKLVG